MKEKQGSLVKTSMPKLLHLVYREKNPVGILDIIREPVKKRFYFKNGVPVAASSNVLNEVLGRLLMQEGVITQKEYESSLETVLKEKKRHGEVLISLGLITPGDLDKFLALQLKRRVWRIFSWDEGAYVYTKAQTLPGGITHIPINPARLILDGISLGFYPLDRIKKDLSGCLDSPLTFIPDTGLYSLGDLGLTIQEKRFLESFDGKKTVREVLEGSDLLRQRALSIALTAIITGLVKKTGAEEEAPEEEVAEAPAQAPAKEARAEGFAAQSRLNAELLFMRAKTALSKGNFADAKNVLKEITDINPLEGEYWAYLGWAVFNEDPGKIREAEQLIKDSIDLNNELDSAWYFLGRISLFKGDIKGAEQALRTAIAKNPWMLEAVSEIKRIEIKRSLAVRDEGKRIKYMSHFGFAEDPFTGAPVEKFTTLSARQAMAREFLIKGITERSGPLLLEGGACTGKTTVALELLKALTGKKIACAMILKPPPKEIDFVKAINAELGSSTESSSIKEQVLSLGLRVSQNKIQGGHTIIVIDNAQLLSSGCLKLLQYLSRLKSLQILFLAEASFTPVLKGPEFKELGEKLASRFTLDEKNPLTIEETREYVLMRLHTALRTAQAGVPEFALAQRDLALLYEKSRGVPELINKFASEMLFDAAEAAEFEVPIEEEKISAEAAPEKVSEVFFETPEAIEAPPEAPPPKAEEPKKLPQAPPETPIKPEKPSSVEAPLKPVGRPPVEAPREKKPVLELPPSEKRRTVEPKEAPKAVPTGAEAIKETAAAFKGGPPPLEEKAAKRKGILSLIIWVLVMLIAGLVIGSLIGIFWYGYENKEPNEIQMPVKKPPVKEKAEKVETVAPVAGTAGIQGSIEGSNEPAARNLKPEEVLKPKQAP